MTKTITTRPETQRLARSLFASWLSSSRDERKVAGLAMADLLTEQGHGEDGVTQRLRAGKRNVTNMLDALEMLGGKAGRKNVANAVRAELKATTLTVYEARRDRAVNPEGDFDKQGRWYPSPREDAGDVTRTVRSPSKAYPYSYMLRARTKDHCDTLVLNGVCNEDVPNDVKGPAAKCRQAILAILEINE